MMQTLTCRGQVVGKTIVLESELGLPDGAQVEVEIRLHLPAETLAERQQALQRLFSMNLPVADWKQMEQETIVMDAPAAVGGLKRLRLSG
jgi:hypothetical protein